MPLFIEVRGNGCGYKYEGDNAATKIVSHQIDEYGREIAYLTVETNGGYDPQSDRMWVMLNAQLVATDDGEVLDQTQELKVPWKSVIKGESARFGRSLMDRKGNTINISATSKQD